VREAHELRTEIAKADLGVPNQAGITRKFDELPSRFKVEQILASCSEIPTVIFLERTSVISRS
jgi:hypothetical protein